MARFVGIPSVPLDADPDLARVLYALKENVELLTDQRGETDKASVAVTQDRATVPTVGTSSFRALTARGLGATISDIPVPLQADYVKALNDIQRLAADVANLQSVVNLLITQLRNQR